MKGRVCVYRCAGDVKDEVWGDESGVFEECRQFDTNAGSVGELGVVALTCPEEPAFGGGEGLGTGGCSQVPRCCSTNIAELEVSDCSHEWLSVYIAEGAGLGEGGLSHHCCQWWGASV